MEDSLPDWICDFLPNFTSESSLVELFHAADL